jgi:hypothetical protein
MFARSVAACAAALAFLTPLVLPTAVQAQVPVLVAPPYLVSHGHFVEFRPFPRMPWQVSGPFGSPRHAHRVAHNLRVQGYHTRVMYR